MNYNPFSKKDLKETEHGTINYEHKSGRIYMTFRRPEHVFKKFQAFCISCSEVETCLSEGVKWIMINYKNKKEEETIMRIKTEEIKELEQYNNNGDIQIIIPIKKLEVIT